MVMTGEAAAGVSAAGAAEKSCWAQVAFSQLNVYSLTLPRDSIPSAVSIRLDLLDPLCMPLTMPEGGRSMFAGRSEEEEEVVAVTSGGAETFSEGKRQNLESYGINSKNNTLNLLFSLF